MAFDDGYASSSFHRMPVLHGSHHFRLFRVMVRNRAVASGRRQSTVGFAGLA
jgi:hypothetical protein